MMTMTRQISGVFMCSVRIRAYLPNFDQARTFHSRVGGAGPRVLASGSSERRAVSGSQWYQGTASYLSKLAQNSRVGGHAHTHILCRLQLNYGGLIKSKCV